MKAKVFICAFLLVSAAVFSSSGQKGLAVGDKVPVFRAPADDGTTWDISKFLGKEYIVVYFYPGAMTGGCTKQACSYRDHISKLDSVNALVVGISSDNIGNLKLFRQAENLNFTLLSDEKGVIAGKFGVPLGEGGSIRRTVAGTEHELVRDISVKRWTFIIGLDGKVIYKNESVNPEKDSEEVLSFLKGKS